MGKKFIALLVVIPVILFIALSPVGAEPVLPTGKISESWPNSPLTRATEPFQVIGNQDWPISFSEYFSDRLDWSAWQEGGRIGAIYDYYTKGITNIYVPEAEYPLVEVRIAQLDDKAPYNHTHFSTTVYQLGPSGRIVNNWYSSENTWRIGTEGSVTRISFNYDEQAISYSTLPGSWNNQRLGTDRYVYYFRFIVPDNMYIENPDKGTWPFGFPPGDIVPWDGRNIIPTTVRNWDYLRQFGSGAPSYEDMLRLLAWSRETEADGLITFGIFRNKHTNKFYVRLYCRRTHYSLDSLPTDYWPDGEHDLRVPGKEGPRIELLLTTVLGREVLVAQPRPIVRSLFTREESWMVTHEGIVKIKSLSPSSRHLYDYMPTSEWACVEFGVFDPLDDSPLPDVVNPQDDIPSGYFPGDEDDIPTGFLAELRDMFELLLRRLFVPGQIDALPLVRLGGDYVAPALSLLEGFKSLANFERLDALPSGHVYLWGVDVFEGLNSVLGYEVDTAILGTVSLYSLCRLFSGIGVLLFMVEGVVRWSIIIFA
ncbi:MAG: hypothetical protein QXT77_09030 [Candidatus Methanomethylicaceae archaeon]